MRLTRFIYQPRWQSMWVRALSEVAAQDVERDRTNAQPKVQPPAPRRARAVDIHCIEHI